MKIFSKEKILVALLFITSLILSGFNKTANIHIQDSYCIWSPRTMRSLIQEAEYNSSDVSSSLHRSYTSMYVEWWLHNIGYYITKPLCFIDGMQRINFRCKDVDL